MHLTQPAEILDTPTQHVRKHPVSRAVNTSVLDSRIVHPSPPGLRVLVAITDSSSQSILVGGREIVSGVDLVTRNP